MDRLESARFHDILVLGVLFVAGFVVSILSCIYSKNRKGAKPLLAPHPGKRSVATSCGRSATRSSSTRPRSLNGHGLLRSKGSPSQPAVQRGPPPDCGTSVSVSRSPGASRARDMSQQRRPEGAAPSQEAMDLRNGPAVQKLLERFEDLSARLRQHIKQHVSVWSLRYGKSWMDLDFDSVFLFQVKLFSRPVRLVVVRFVSREALGAGDLCCLVRASASAQIHPHLNP